MIFLKRNAAVVLCVAFFSALALSQPQDKKRAMTIGAEGGDTPTPIRDSVVTVSDGAKIHFLAA